MDEPETREDQRGEATGDVGTEGVRGGLMGEEREARKARRGETTGVGGTEGVGGMEGEGGTNGRRAEEVPTFLGEVSGEGLWRRCDH